MAGAAGLLVEDLHAYYGDGHILQGVNLEIAPGRIVAVLGRNGVGKTTTLRSIIGLTPPRRGRGMMTPSNRSTATIGARDQSRSI